MKWGCAKVSRRLIRYLSSENDPPGNVMFALWNSLVVWDYCRMLL
jgi:hypothetical protein